IRFLKDFNFSSALGVDFMLTEAKQKTNPLLAASSIAPGSGVVAGRDMRNGSIITTNILRYDKTLGSDHRLNVLGGQEAQIITNDALHVERTNITSDPLTDQLLTGTLSLGIGTNNKQTLLSYFG